MFSGKPQKLYYFYLWISCAVFHMINCKGNYFSKQFITEVFLVVLF